MGICPYWGKRESPRYSAKRSRVVVNMENNEIDDRIDVVSSSPFDLWLRRISSALSPQQERKIIKINAPRSCARERFCYDFRSHDGDETVDGRSTINAHRKIVIDTVAAVLQ